MTKTSTTRLPIRRLRQLLVLMHMMTAFGWLALCAAMLVLTLHGMSLDDQSARHDVFAVAAHLDDNMLADFSFVTVYTGLMLAGLTPWGYTRFWWVTVKLVLAIGCALGGRAVLSRWLAQATTEGHRIPSDALVWGTVLLIAAITFMAWVARTKPWGQIGHNRQPAQPWGHPALWVIVLVTPVADYVTDLPLQAIPAAIVLGHHARHTLLTRRRTRAETPAYESAPGCSGRGAR